MDEFQKKALAAEIVDEIAADILDRKGLGDEFGQIDEVVRDEIREAWMEIVKNVLSAPGA